MGVYISGLTASMQNCGKVYRSCANYTGLSESTQTHDLRFVMGYQVLKFCIPFVLGGGKAHSRQTPMCARHQYINNYSIKLSYGQLSSTTNGDQCKFEGEATFCGLVNIMQTLFSKRHPVFSNLSTLLAEIAIFPQIESITEQRHRSCHL